MLFFFFIVSLFPGIFVGQKLFKHFISQGYKPLSSRLGAWSGGFVVMCVASGIFNIANEDNQVQAAKVQTVPVVQAQNKSIENAHQTSPESSKKSVTYPFAELDKPIAHVDIYDDPGIIKSAGVRARQIDTKGEADSRGEPYTRFEFDKKLSAGIQLSRERILVNWYKIEDEPSAMEISIKSLRIAQNVSRALMGNDGALMVDSVMAGGTKTARTINGVNVDRASCSAGMCLLVINR